MRATAKSSAPRSTSAIWNRPHKSNFGRPTNDDDSPLIVPQVRLQDVVLPEVIREHVCEITLAARSRRMVLERWKVGDHLTYGKGVSALFHGPPGTGKTLCAQAIAGELNRPLYAASIPSLVSQVGRRDG